MSFKENVFCAKKLNIINDPCRLCEVLDCADRDECYGICLVEQNESMRESNSYGSSDIFA